MSDNRIATIELRGMLPEVFASEGAEGSEVWLKDLDFRRGCRVMVEAASGTGKSSLCAYIYGTRTDYHGRLLFSGRDARSISMDAWQDLRRRNLAYLPQELGLFPELTALENIRLKNDLTGHCTEEEIDRRLELLGIDSRSHFPVGRMSVGQQQRVALLRCLCQPFDFLLLDEPVSHLDADNNAVAARLVEEEAERQGAGIIATSVGNRLRLDSFVTLRL